MKKITTMDQLTLYSHKQEYKVEIDEKFTSLSNLVEIEDLENPVPGFFSVESIGKENQKIFLVYDVPESYESFSKAKHFEFIIKLQLVQSLLKKDPLLECKNQTYLDLNNVFFKDFNDIKLLYRSNGVLPFHKDMSPLNQYKLFILGFLSKKYSYKQFIIHKDNCLKKENSELFYAINAAETFPDLKLLIDQEVLRSLAGHYKKLQFEVDSKKKGKKRTFIIGTMIVVIAALLFAGGLKQKEKNVAMEYEEKIKSVQLDNDIYKAISSGDTKQAIVLMKKNGDSNTEIANMLVDSGQYDEAITFDKKIEEKVVSKLYDLGQKQKILSLKSNSDFIQLEKEIVKYNKDDLYFKIPLITNKNSLKRLGLTYVENGEINTAKEVQQKLNDKELANQIKKVELEKEIETYYSKLYQLKGKGKADTDQEVQKINDTVLTLQKKLLLLEEKIRSEK